MPSSDSAAMSDAALLSGALNLSETYILTREAFGDFYDHLAPDGRVSHFPRAMCRLQGADGRGGLGWLEWNRSQPPAAGR